MGLSSVKDAVRAATRLQVVLAEGGRMRMGTGTRVSHEKACEMVAKAMGYRDHAHLVDAFGSVDTTLPKVVAGLRRGSLMESDIVEAVFPWARGDAPPAHSLDWRQRREFIDLDQNTPFIDALAKCPAGRAIVLKGDSYTGKSSLVGNRSLGMGGRRGGGCGDEGGISFGFHSAGTPGSFASDILSALDPKHDFGGKVSAKVDELHRRIDDMPARVIALDNLDWIGSRNGRRARETVELIASLVDGSRHRWVLIGIGADSPDGRAGIDHVVDMSPRLRGLVDATVELPLHHGDDADVERMARAWEMDLPIPDRGFFTHPSNRRKLMEAVDAPIGIGIVGNGLQILGKALRSSINPSTTDMSALLDAMIVDRDKRRREEEDLRLQMEKERAEARAKARARRRAPAQIGRVTVAELLTLPPMGGGSEFSRYSGGGKFFAWEVEALGVRFTCQVGHGTEPMDAKHTLTITAMDKSTERRSGDVSIRRGVVTVGKGSALRMLQVRFEPNIVPGWTDHGRASNHRALAAAVTQMLEERQIDADTVREVRSLVRILRDATGAGGAGVIAATAVSRQRVHCQGGPSCKEILGDVADLVLRDYPMTGWRYAPDSEGSVVPVRIDFWQIRDPKPPSSLDSITRRIRDNLPRCSEELGKALIDLHARAVGEGGRR